MLAAVSYVGRQQVPRFAAFFGCLHYAMLRPEEARRVAEWAGRTSAPNDPVVHPDRRSALATKAGEDVVGVAADAAEGGG
jgi:hypothetical protein